jgi:hypothetical protein
MTAILTCAVVADFGLVPANAFGSCLGLWYTLSIFGSCKDQRIKVLIERGLVTGVAVPSVLASILAFGVEVGALCLSASSPLPELTDRAPAMILPGCCCSQRCDGRICQL